MDTGGSASSYLIRLAYEGIFRIEAWGEMLALACSLFRAQDSYLARIPANGEGPRLVLTHGVEPKVAEAYSEAWCTPPKNPVLTRLFEARLRGVAVRTDFLSDSELERTDYFEMGRRPRGIDAEVGCGDMTEGGELRFLTVNRATGDPQFGELEKKLMAFAYPHVVQALRHDAALSAERARTGWAGSAIEVVREAVLRRNPDGRLVPINAAGEAFLRVEGAGEWEGDALLPRDPRPSSRSDGPSRAVGTAGTEKSFRSGRRYRVFASPRFEEDRFVGEVLIIRPARRAAVTDAALGKLTFTPQEKRVADLLFEGRTSQEICGDLGIGQNTLNTHVRHLFEKTHCHSRAQLVIRLGTLRREAAQEDKDALERNGRA